MSHLWAFLASSLIVLLLAAPAASQSFSPDKALLWSAPQEPSRTTFNLSQDHSKLSVLLGDSVIITKASLHQKNQIFIRDFFVDISSPARAGFNLFEQASRYEGMRLTNVENFISHQSFSNEYKIHGLLDHNRCETLCLLEKAHLPSTARQIQELESLHGSLQDSYWIEVSQHISADEYFLSFDNSPLFPKNSFSNGTLQLFHFYDDRYQKIEKSKLHGITTYYSYESDSYYNRQFHQLTGRMDMARNVQVLVPLSSTAHAGAFSRATCLCVRDLSENLKDSYEAQALTKRAQFRALRSPRHIEVQRIKSITSDPKSSNVLSILAEPKFYTSPAPSFLAPSDLHPLRIEDHRELAGRSRRALPLAAKLSLVMAAKLAQFSLPYALSGQENILQRLQTEIKGKLLSVPVSQVNGSSFQKYLDNNFNTGPMSVQLLEDRVSVSYEGNSEALRSLKPPSLRHAQKLHDISYDLKFVEKELLPNLASALLLQLVAHLPYQINPGSPVLLKTTTAGTFQRHRFWLELYRHDLSYTHFQAKSLPFQNINGEYTTYKVPNSSILDIKQHSGGPLESQTCLRHLLADRNSVTSGLCATEVYKHQSLELLFEMQAGRVFNFYGPATLHLECFQHVSSALTLQHEFNIIYLSNSCSASVDKRHQTSDVLASAAVYHEHPYQVIVQIDVPKITSKYEKIYFWLIVLSTSSLLLVCGFLLLYGVVYYVRVKYRPQMSVNADGVIDISVRNIPKPLTCTPASSTTILSNQPDGESHRSDKRMTRTWKEGDESCVLSAEGALNNVFFHASTENISLPLEPERPQGRKQKPAAH